MYSFIKYLAILFLALICGAAYEASLHAPGYIETFSRGGSAEWIARVTTAAKQFRKELFLGLSPRERFKAYLASGKHSCLGRTCEVVNKNEALDAVDEIIHPEAATGLSKKPAIEFLFVEPSYAVGSSDWVTAFTNFCFGYGHAVLRYTLPPRPEEGNAEERDIIVNICNTNVPGKSLISMIDPTDFFFSLDEATSQMNEQYGIYNRHFSGIRVESASEDQLYRLHEYFHDLQRRSDDRNALYSLTAVHSYAYHTMRVLGLMHEDTGNCAEWISEGLQHAGFLTRRRVFPKQIVVDLASSYNDARMVYYQKAMHALPHEEYENWETDCHGQTHPMAWLSSFLFWDLSRYADVIVSVSEDDGGNQVRVEPNVYKVASLSAVAGAGWLVRLIDVTRAEAATLSLMLMFTALKSRSFLRSIALLIFFTSTPLLGAMCMVTLFADHGDDNISWMLFEVTVLAFVVAPFYLVLVFLQHLGLLLTGHSESLRLKWWEWVVLVVCYLSFYCHVLLFF